jgi:hypothetical protein
MRFHLSPRSDYARAIQRGRFDGDDDRWKELTALPKKVSNGRRLVLHLRNSRDIELFSKFIENDLPNVKWLESAADGDTEDGDDRDDE